MSEVGNVNILAFLAVVLLHDQHFQSFYRCELQECHVIFIYM